MANNNRIIVEQLQALANAMEQLEEEEMLPMILDACGGLLQQVQSRRLPVAQMDEIDLVGYIARYSGISAMVETFAQDLRGDASVAADSARLKDAMAELETERKEHQRLANSLSVVKENLQNQQNANKTLEEQVLSEQKELKRLEDFHQTLLNMEKTCAPEIIAAQKQANEVLLQEYNQAQSNLEVLQNEKTELENQLQANGQKVAEVQERIDQVPEENKRLLAEFEEKTQLLERLERSLEDCSPEKQTELATKINTLKPEEELLRGKMENLRAIYEGLTTAKNQLDQEKQVLEAELLEYLHTSLGQLYSIMEKHREELSQIREQAEKYTKSLEACNKLKEGYEDWFGVNRNQLDMLLKAIDREESTNLRETLSPGSQAKIREAFDKARQALNEADRLLQRCADAVTCDRREIERRVGAR